MPWVIAGIIGLLLYKKNQGAAVASAAQTQPQSVAVDYNGDPVAPNQKAIAPGVLTYNPGAPLPVPPQMAPVAPSPIVPPLPVAPRFSLPVSAQRFALTGRVRQMMELE